MYLPRALISHLYMHLSRTHHALSPPVLLLVALEPDALCACRILTALLKRDYIPHKIQPISGYDDLARAGEQMVRPMRTTEGGSGGVVVCLGVGGLVDLGAMLGLDVQEEEENGMGGVEVWVIDARRPWNLGNVFGGLPAVPAVEDPDGSRGIPGVDNGQIQHSYKPGRGGIIVFDDGDIDEDLVAEREAYCALVHMPEVDDDDVGDSGSSGFESEDEPSLGNERPLKKRKSVSEREEEEEEEDGEERGMPKQRPSKKRKSLSDGEDNGESEHEDDDEPSRTKRPRTSSRSTSPATQRPSSLSRGGALSPRTLRRRFVRLRRKHETVLRNYYELGNSYSEPVSSLMYSLASELGREDNDLLWLAIIGVGSLELYGRGLIGVGVSQTTADEIGGSAGWGGERGERIRQILRDEVRRLNPPGLSETGREMSRGEASGVIPTHARSPTDTSIRLSPEPRFLLIRHWSLYESMLHSPYLSARLHIWSDAGRKRLHKLLAKMGVSLAQCKQSYTHMDMELKRGLRARLLKYAPIYGLDGLVPPDTSMGSRGREGWGFVRNWGFKACLSATDVGVIIGAILEVGKTGVAGLEAERWDRGGRDQQEAQRADDEEGRVEGDEWVSRFWEAYDALENVDALKSALPTAMHLHRAILRTGTSLIEKRQIRHLRAFRMAVVKDGPDVQLFTHPAALTKLALWLGEAIAEQDRERQGEGKREARGTPLVVASLNERRGVYVVVGTGRGGGRVLTEASSTTNTTNAPARHKREMNTAKAAAREQRRIAKAEKRAQRESRRKQRHFDHDGDDDNDEDDSSSSSSSSSNSSSSDDDDPPSSPIHRGHGLNRFGAAFQDVVAETQARVRIDSFEHCVVEVKKDDLAAFLESLSLKSVVG